MYQSEDLLHTINKVSFAKEKHKGEKYSALRSFITIQKYMCLSIHIYIFSHDCSFFDAFAKGHFLKYK